jgi:LacI family transcriptional regulator
MGNVRLKDIAARANVSINTVSRALKSKSDISLSTIRKIKKIAEEMGYVPDAAAVGLRSRTSKAVGVIITYIDNSFFARILQGINDVVSTHGYTIITLASNEDLDKETEILKLLTAYRVSGILLVPSRDLISEFNYDGLRVPHITIVRKGSLNTESYFITDSFSSGTLAGHYAISKDRKHPAYLGFDLPVSCNQTRLQGYLRALEQAGLGIGKKSIRMCDATAEDAYSAAIDWFRENPRIDFLFVYNDQMAMGVLHALHDLGVKVPDDVSVLGHDDIEAARHYTPSISTIRVPKYSLGYESASCLMDLIRNKGKKNTTKTVYEPELVVRET